MEILRLVPRRTFLRTAGATFATVACDARPAHVAPPTAVGSTVEDVKRYAKGIFITNGRQPLRQIQSESFRTILPAGSSYQPSQHSSLTVDTKRDLLVLLDQHALAFFTMSGKYVRDVLLFNDGNIPAKTFGGPEWRYRYQDCEGLAYLASRDSFLIAMEDQYHVHEVDQRGNLVKGGISIQADIRFPHRWGANMEGISPVDDEAGAIWFVQEDLDPFIACMDRTGRITRLFRSDAEDLSDIQYVREHDVLLVLSHMSGSVALYTPHGRFIESFQLRYGRGSTSGRRCLHKAEGLFWLKNKLYVAGEGEEVLEVYDLPLGDYLRGIPRGVPPARPPIHGPFVMHLSISDFSQIWGKSSRTYGEEGVRSLLDSVYETGVRVVNWRTTCSGALNYPTRVEGADTYRSPTLGKATNVDFGSWDSFAAAIKYAHSRGMQIWAWYDQTDSHGGCGGESVHNSFLLKHPYTTRCPLPGGRPSPVEVSEHRDPNCPLRGRGTQASLAFPEVQQFRLNIIREAVEKGVDGVYLVAGSIGFEEPVTQSFLESLRLSAGTDVDPADPRWVTHQAGFLVDYMKRVRAVTSSGARPCRLVLEFRGPTKQTSGLRPYVLEAIPQLINEDVVDGVSVWVAEDVYKLRDRYLISAKRIHRRYEFSRNLDAAALESTFRDMLTAGVGAINLDEATAIEPDGWPLFKRLIAKVLEEKG